MNSRILNSFKTVLSLTAASSLMTGCIFGENKQFFQTGTPVDAIVSGVSSDGVIDLDTYTDPTPSPTATPSGTPDHMSTPTPTPTATPDPSPSATPTATPTATPSPSPTATPTATPSPTATPVHTALAHESFVAARSQVKKLDFLFVVDNSGSMADNQARLADGFEAFANAFYRRADLDICTAIITTDRYLGRTNSSGSYSRERVLPCTKPAGSENWSQAQTNAYIDSLIAEFRSKINVGTNGSGTELTGKSLVTYLHNANKWADGINVNQRVSFFRADAVSNVSIVTDENNWYYSGAGTSESSNDIPVITNATIWNSNSGAIDARKGIKNYLDGFFTGLNPGQGLSYSVTTFLELTKPATSVPGISKNLDTLAHLVGRESASADIAGSAQNYANVYSAVGTAVAIRAAAFNLAHDIYEPLFPTVQDVVVKMVRASDGAITTLSNGSDYAIMLPNGIVLNQAVSDAAAVGDQVTVDYRYQTP